jgi:hypothetical protein
MQLLQIAQKSPRDSRRIAQQIERSISNRRVNRRRPPQTVTIDPDAISEEAIDRLIIPLAEYLAEVEFRRQQSLPEPPHDDGGDPGVRKTPC